MEADGGFLSRRRMAVEVEVPRGDGGGGSGVVATGVTGGGAAEIRWRGGRVLNTGGFFGGSGGGFSPRTAPTAAAAAAGMEPDFASTPHRTPTPPPPELCASTSTSTPEGDADAEYEGLPRGVPTTTHMMAGAVAGVMEHCVMFPVDCVKTRMQSLRPDAGVRYRNVVDALRQIVRTEGLWRPVRGVNVMAAGAGPAHAMYFACYEKIKFSLSNTIHPGANSHFANGVAGCMATVLHDAVMNPAEVVKQRVQMFNSPYRGVVDCAAATLRAEGPAAFYRSYTTQLAMNVPYQSLHFMAYEYLQELLNPRRHYDPASHMVSGALAGALAASATTPLDVCKTLLNTQEALALPATATATATASRHISGLGAAFQTVYRMGGAPAFFKGAQARVIYQMPSTGISWSVYELFKYLLTERQHRRSLRPPERRADN